MAKPETGDKNQELFTPLKELLVEDVFVNVKDFKNLVLDPKELTKIDGFKSLSENIDMLTPIKEVRVLSPLPTGHSKESKEGSTEKENK